jgi:hypothetical protein
VEVKLRNMLIFSSEAILDALQASGGRGSKRRIRASLREKGYDIPNDEFDFHFDQLLRSGRIRPMIGEPSKLEDVYEVTTARHSNKKTPSG